MNRRFIIIILGGTLFFLPHAAEAASRFYVSFSVGGAIVVGSGFIFWNIGYTQELKRPPEEESPESVAHLRPENGEKSPRPFSSPLFDEKPEGVRRRSVEVPLFIYRW